MNSKVGEKVLESAVELNCATVAVWFYHHPKDGRGKDARGRRVGTERGGKEKEREGEEEREDARRNDERGDAERRRDESIVAVGSYEHTTTTKSGGAEEGEEEAKEERIGRVTLFRCSRKREEEEKEEEEKEEENVNASSPDSSSSRSRRPRGEEKISFDVCGELDAISRARCGGAFDLKFGNASRSEGGRVELAMACANNRLEVFEMTMDGDADFDDDDGGKQERLVRLKPTAQFECGFGGIGLCTSAAWSCRDRSIVATGDDGAAVVVDYERATMMASSGGRDGVEGDNSQVLFRVENAHADAIWASSFLDGSEDVFFTGGDDCKLIKHDLREMGSRSSGEFAYPSQTSQNFRFEKNPVFDAGVTSIESKGDILYVGSYDGACRAFDVRKSLKEPLWISRGNDDENEDGEEAASIWRVRLHPNFAATSKRSGKIALASMKAGCRVISSLDGSTVGTYRNGHDDDKVVYGCDWAFTNDATEEEDEKEGFVSCSFYDRRVHVWTL
jgi:WD40 repeat protein